MNTNHFNAHQTRPTFTMKTKLALLALLALVANLVNVLHASDANPPDRITYQGFLVDGAGVALGNSAPKNYDIVFRIYNASTAGTRLWTEQQTVTVDKGYFSVLLGEGSLYQSEGRPMPLANLFTGTDASDRFLAMTVKGIGNPDADILPRLRLLTAPYAALARYAVTASSIGGSNSTVLSLTSTNVGINKSNPGSSLDVNGTVTATALIAAINATNITSGVLDIARIPDFSAAKLTSGSLADSILSTNVMLRAGGNTNIGNQIILSTNRLGIGTTIPATSLQVAVGVDNSLAANAGYALFGLTSGVNLIIDNNEIMARDNGVGSDLFLNNWGGTVYIGSSATTNQTAPSLQVNSQNLGPTEWSIKVRNAGNPGFVGGIRLADNGFFEFSNVAEANNPVFARLASNGAWTTVSDRRRKKDIAFLNGLLDGALRLRPVMFHFKEQSENDPAQMGFIAQEVQEVFPSLVTDGDTMSLNYSGLSVVAIGAVQELSAKVKSLESEVSDLKKTVARLQEQDKRLSQLEALMAKTVASRE
jgi:hypothetical protein